MPSNSQNRLNTTRTTYQDYLRENLDAIKEEIKSGKFFDMNLGARYSDLANIAIKNPELANEVLATYRKALKSDKNNSDSLGGAYESLGFVVEKRPELTGEILNIVNEGLNNGHKEAHLTLQKIDINKTLDIYKKMLESDGEMNVRDLQSILYGLEKSAIKSPEYEDKIFDTFNKLIEYAYNNNVRYKDEFYQNHSDILKTTFKVLKNIAIKRPELADKVFNTYEKAMKSGKNNRNSLGYDYGTTIRYAYKNLCDIANENPEFSKKAFSLVRQDFPYKFHPDLEKCQLFILSRAMQSPDAKEFIDNATQHKEELQACYNMRFATQDECFSLMRSKSIKEIAAMNLSQEQSSDNKPNLSQMIITKNGGKDI